MEQLRLLRATDPNPPMVSILDIGEDDMRDPKAFASTGSGPPPASTATLCVCCRLKDAELHRLRRLNAAMQARLAAIEAEMLKPAFG